MSMRISSGTPKTYATASGAYSVQRGDTMWAIAQRFGVSLGELIRANPHIQNANLIYPGQQVYVPGRRYERPAAEGKTGAATSYTVRPNDTLGGIARAHGFGLQELIGANPQIANPNRIYPGQSINFPGTPRRREDDVFEPTAPRTPVTSNPVTGGGNLPAPYSQWLPYVKEAAQKYNLPPELIYAVMSRETNGRNVRGDGGHGRGLMQIDDRSHGSWLASHQGGMDPRSNIDYGASIIRQNLDYFRGNLKAALAAYNAGPGAVGSAVRAGRDPDSVTTGRNYGSDVIQRMEHFRQYFS